MMRITIHDAVIRDLMGPPTLPDHPYPPSGRAADGKPHRSLQDGSLAFCEGETTRCAQKPLPGYLAALTRDRASGVDGMNEKALHFRRTPLAQAGLVL